MTYDQLYSTLETIKESIDRSYSAEAALMHLMKISKNLGLTEEISPCFIQQEFIGVDCIVTRKDGAISISIADGVDVTNKFPAVCESFSTLKYDAFSFKAVLEDHINGVISNEAVLLESINTETFDDATIMAQCYDVIINPINNDDVSGLTFKERFKILSSIDFPQSKFSLDISKHVNLAPTSFVSNPDELKKAFTYFTENTVHPMRINVPIDGLPFDHMISANKESQHKNSQCMQCEAKPTFEYLWAEGMAHAWFCSVHAKQWEAEHKDDVNSKKEIKDGLAVSKFSDNKNPNILSENVYPYSLIHHWWSDSEVEQWELIVKDKSMRYILNANISEANATIFYTTKLTEEISLIGGSVAKIQESNGSPSWMSRVTHGKMRIISSDNIHKEFEFLSGLVSGVWHASREKDNSSLWNLSLKE